jgi:hypothetical protein
MTNGYKTNKISSSIGKLTIQKIFPKYNDSQTVFPGVPLIHSSILDFITDTNIVVLHSES